MRAAKRVPVVGAALVSAGVLLLLLGVTLGFGSRVWIWGGVLAFPIAALLAALTLALGVVVVTVAVRPLRTKSNVVVTSTVAAAITATAAAALITLPPVVPLSALPDRSEYSELRALAWNVRQEGVPAETLVSLLDSTDADIAVFAELYSGGGAERFPGGHFPDGYQMLDSEAIAVTAFISTALGEYKVVAADNTGAWTGFVAEPVDATSDSPRIIAVHVTRMSLIGGDGLWQHGLDWIAAQCATPNTIALGDFNASSANIPDGLGMCKLATPGQNVGLAPTWPTSVPTPLGATIDQVLATSDWRTVFARTLDIDAPGTDHRPVFSLLDR
ncbi:MAG: endonuclease/exonuclease/phosphatase family protein [Protaetiibacter sp.]